MAEETEENGEQDGQKRQGEVGNLCCKPGKKLASAVPSAGFEALVPTDLTLSRVDSDCISEMRRTQRAW